MILNRIYYRNTHSELLLNEDLIKLQNMNEIPIEEEEPDNKLTVKSLTIKNMNETFIQLEKILSIIEECDPNEDCISHVQKTIEKDIACYRTFYEKKCNWHTNT